MRKIIKVAFLGQYLKQKWKIWKLPLNETFYADSVSKFKINHVAMCCFSVKKMVFKIFLNSVFLFKFGEASASNDGKCKFKL